MGKLLDSAGVIFSKNRIFEPLDMKRTEAYAMQGVRDNVSTGYIALNDASTIEVPPVSLSGETTPGAGGAMHSSAHNPSFLVLQKESHLS